MSIIRPEDIGRKYPDPDEMLADEAASGGEDYCKSCGRMDVPLTEVGDELYCLNCEEDLEEEDFD